MLYLASSNRDKFKEIARILGSYSIAIIFKEVELLEIQSDLESIAKYKAEQAYGMIKDEVIVEDDGIFIDSLNGFPGIYSSYVYKTLGNDGILKLMEGLEQRNARFVSVIVYHDGSPRIFKGVVEGIIAYSKQGDSWGYDPIFIPKGYNLTYAELKYEKDRVSHRSLALKAFAEWYKNRSTLE